MVGNDELALRQTADRTDWFTATHWTTILDAGRCDDSPQASVGLAKVCQTYWSPVYSYVRRRGYPAEDARDLTQAFFCRLIEKEYLKSVERDRGRFRSFLLTLLHRFLADEWDRANCQKRGGDRPMVSLDDRDAELSYLSEPVDNRTPDKIFEQRWALTLIDQALHRLQTEMVAAGQGERFSELSHFLCGDTGLSYSEAAGRLQMSESTLHVTVHRVRVRFSAIFREEIALTVTHPDQIEDEMRHLALVLS